MEQVLLYFLAVFVTVSIIWSSIYFTRKYGICGRRRDLPAAEDTNSLLSTEEKPDALEPAIIKGQDLDSETPKLT